MASTSLSVSQSGLLGVAAQLFVAAGNLETIAAVPPVHAPLAPDEVSQSAAARLSEHGAVLASRASDGAAVLAAAGHAVTAVLSTFVETDIANAAAMALTGSAATPPAPAASPPAIKLNAAAADTGIAPMAPRPGEVTAGLIHAGSTTSGAPFNAACRSYSGAFAACASATRTAQSAVAGAVTGDSGPRLVAALSQFATWADAMASHSTALGSAAVDHSNRFAQTQYQTPKTQEFDKTRQALARASALNVQTGGRYSAVVSQLQTQLAQLDSNATAAGMSYHLAELPRTPPPAPPVTDIVDDHSAQHAGGQPTQTGASDDQSPDSGESNSQGTGPIDSSEASSAAGNLTDDALDGNSLQQLMPMAAMIPSMVAGSLGGALGAVTGIPQQLGQQVTGAAQQVMQAASTAMAPKLDMGASDAGASSLTDLSSLSDFGGGGGVGGGETEPAAGVDTSMPSTGGMLAAASAPATSGLGLPTASTVAGQPPVAAVAGAGGGMPMMPMMGGMGAAGAAAGRQVDAPDKKVVVPPLANGEPVKGEVERRKTVSAETSVKPKDDVSPAVGKPRRRVAVPSPESEDQR